MKTKILRSILLSLSFLFAVSFTSSAIDSSYNCPMGGMMYGAFGGYGTGAMLFSWIIYVLVIVLIIAAIYWFFKSASRKK